jgi:multidrug transporter EmrE-like cation transporter
MALLIFFEAVADIFAKNWSIHKSVWIAVTSLTFYLIANSFWLFALKNGAQLGRGAIIFSVASAIIAILLGVLLYKEPVSKLQTAGLILGVVSIILLFWE